MITTVGPSVSATRVLPDHRRQIQRSRYQGQHPVRLTHDLVIIYHQNLNVFLCYKIRSHSRLLRRFIASNRSEPVVYLKSVGTYRMESRNDPPSGKFLGGVGRRLDRRWRGTCYVAAHTFE
jgi:hypothetical protein